MKTRLIVLLLALAAALATAPAALADAGQATRYYLSLGDSLAEGFQPIGVLDEGYADQVHAILTADDPKLRLVKLGCGGETTLSMIQPYLPWEGRGARYHCNHPHGSQLAEAVSFLHAHRGFVSLVTIDIGGNDVLQFGDQAFAVVRANLPRILADLRTAAGPGVPIVGMNYYHPFLAPVWFGTHDLTALQGAVDRVVALNNLLEGFYAAAGDPVADVESAFSVTNLTLVGGTPLNVLRNCQWTWICDLGDIHPNSAGYGVVAGAFLEAVQSERNEP